MSEKRFKLQHINDLTDQEYMRLKKITDNGELITLGEVVDLLNEQQATIDKLQEENTRLNQVIIDLHDDMRRCKQKIKMQDHIIDTQQDIINAFCELVGMINDKE